MFLRVSKTPIYSVHNAFSSTNVVRDGQLLNAVWSATQKQYFPAVLCLMLYKMVLTFDSVDKALRCCHSNESYRAVLSCFAAVYYMPYNMVITVETADEILKCDHSSESY